MALMSIVASTILHFVLKYENRKAVIREREAETAGNGNAVGRGYRYLIYIPRSASGDV